MHRISTRFTRFCLQVAQPSLLLLFLFLHLFKVPNNGNNLTQLICVKMTPKDYEKYNSNPEEKRILTNSPLYATKNYNVSYAPTREEEAIKLVHHDRDYWPHISTVNRKATYSSEMIYHEISNLILQLRHPWVEQIRELLNDQFQEFFRSKM